MLCAGVLCLRVLHVVKANLHEFCMLCCDYMTVTWCCVIRACASKRVCVIVLSYFTCQHTHISDVCARTHMLACVYVHIYCTRCKYILRI